MKQVKVQELSVALWREETVPALRQGTAYHCAAWGCMVAKNTGGRFAVFCVSVGPHTRYLPVIIGGKLAPDGFASGAIGYGGALDDVAGMNLEIEDHLQVVRAVEQFSGLPCLKLVTAPLEHAEVGRLTQLVDLPETQAMLWDHVSGNVRTACRKARSAGLRSARLAAADISYAAALLTETQKRVGSPYQTSENFLADLIGADEQTAWGTGVKMGNQLLSVGIFVRRGTHAAYIFNGWDRTAAALCPNQLMLFAALADAAHAGVRTLDLGYSSHEALFKAKRRWNTRVARFQVIERKDGKMLAQGFTAEDRCSTETRWV